ncbi:MAG: stage II sporulation protein M [Nitrososphaerota archaeon]
MKGYSYALALSLAILLTGFLVGYAFHNITGVNILRTFKVVEESPMFKMTEIRVEVVQKTVETVVESRAVKTLEEKPELKTNIKILSTAMGIFFTNFATCYTSALMPLVPLLYYRHVFPIFSKNPEKRRESWRIYRYVIPLAPVMILWFNGFILYMMVSIVETVFLFMLLEGSALIMLSAVGLNGFFNSDTPEEFEKSYEGFWRVAFHAALLLLSSAFVESLHLSEVIRFGW